MKSQTFWSVLLIFLVCTSLTAANYYVAPNGNDSNNGSQNSPFKTITKAISEASSGDTIFLRAGNHNYSSTIVITKNGNASNPIKMYAYNNEKPILNFNMSENSSSRGVVLDGDYWHWKGITIQGAGDNGMLLSGNNNIIENCIFRNNKDSGLQLSRYNTSANSISQWPSNNLILSCESYDNRDSDNEDADGFAAKLTSGTGNIFRKCVAHHNIDDGWDLYTKSDTGPIGTVTLEDCIAHSNGTLTSGGTSGGGDKNGYKLGSSAHKINHIVRRCIAYNNGKHGFTDNGNIGNIEFSNNTSYNNEGYNFHTRDGGSHTFKNNISFGISQKDRLRGNFSAPNSFIGEEGGFTVNSSDFQTLSQASNANPTTNGFLKLKSGSDLIDAGVKTSGISYNGSRPDLGAIEFGGTVDPPTGGDPEINLSASAGDKTVTLNWSIDNLTVTSQEIFRDTDSNPDGRVRIATVNATTRNYNDTSISNGTTYYYWIKVNSSLNSNSVSATPSGGGDSGGGDSNIRIEDTDAGTISYDGSLKSYSTADNGKAINLSNSAGKEIEWQFNAATAGSYQITLRYTRKASMNNSVDMVINGSSQTISLSETASSTFTTTSFTSALTNGANEIILRTNASGESADIDWIEINTTSTNRLSMSQMAAFRIEDTDSGTISYDGSLKSYSAADNGTAINLSNSSGKEIKWNFNSSSAGNSQITLRYTRKASMNNSVVILVNGTSQVISLSETASSAFTTSSFSANLRSGSNEIILRTNAGGESADIDWIEINGGEIIDPPPPGDSDINLSASAGDGSIRLNWTVSDLTVTSQEIYRDTNSDPNGRVRIASVSANTRSYVDNDVNNGTPYFYWIKANGSVNSNVTSATPQGDDGGGGTGDANYDLIGFATLDGGTTGGQGGTSINCSTGDCILDAIKRKKDGDISQPLIIFVNGTITPSNTSATKIDVKEVEDISIIGVGTRGLFDGIGIKIYKSSNIIVQNVTVRRVRIGDKDAISIEGPADHIWIDHCELYAEYQNVDKDYYDGLLDAKRDAEYITYSYNYMHDSWKMMLVGSSDTDKDDRKVTIHHNYFDNVNSRMPLYRGGRAHVFNNYYSGVESTGINTRAGACVKIENNYFKDAKNPIVWAYADEEGKVDQSGNTFDNVTFDFSRDDVNEPGNCSLSIPYSYNSSLNATRDVPSIVVANAGVGKIGSNFTMTNHFQSYSKTEELIVYPLPLEGRNDLTIELPRYTGKETIRVVNLMGIEVLNRPAKAKKDIIDVSNLSEGQYIIQLKTSADTKLKMFIKN
ncbi:right-handed parallel beta-helix repeat-containing protein [Aquimarina sp. W85]|uniref:pectate lyase family protein n=1 Tax=Aquimarina rhodophyticola TaxID=3342246 RepID=UPI0036730E0A